MSVQISRAVHAALLAEAAANPTVEVCGLLLGNGRIERLVYTENVAAEPARSFEIHPAALFDAIRAERAGGERLIGYWHSHPKGRAEPSERDREQAAADGKVWIIVAGREVTAWRMTVAGDFAPLALQFVD